MGQWLLSLAKSRADSIYAAFGQVELTLNLTLTITITLTLFVTELSQNLTLISTPTSCPT